MPEAEKTITEENSFYSKRKISSIAGYKKCLDEFSKNFDKEVSLESDSPIFLDTNVLLRYYSISFTARAKLLEFLQKHQKRIIITSQVQYEFLKNREELIQRFFEQVTSKIPRAFNSDIVNKMNSFLEENKDVLKDYSFVEAGIVKYQTELEDMLKKLQGEVALKKEEHTNLIVKDSFLDFLASCIQCPSLNEVELKVIKDEFGSLSKNLTSDNVSNFLNNPNNAFPGCADIKEKPDDPFGDYIIFHEIMKFMINNKANAAFITFDNAKGDWMSKNKTPLLHYTQNAYSNTGKLLYILDADRTLGELLKINIDSLVPNEAKVDLRPITSDALNEFFINCGLFPGRVPAHFDEEDINEFAINGYIYMSQVERDIIKSAPSHKKYLETQPHLNSVGVIRSGLRVANPNYTIEIQKINDGIPTFMDKEFLKQYRVFDN